MLSFFPLFEMFFLSERISSPLECFSYQLDLLRYSALKRSRGWFCAWRLCLQLVSYSLYSVMDHDSHLIRSLFQRGQFTISFRGGVFSNQPEEERPIGESVVAQIRKSGTCWSYSLFYHVFDGLTLFSVFFRSSVGRSMSSSRTYIGDTMSLSAVRLARLSTKVGVPGGVHVSARRKGDSLMEPWTCRLLENGNGNKYVFQSVWCLDR